MPFLTKPGNLLGRSDVSIAFEIVDCSAEPAGIIDREVDSQARLRAFARRTKLKRIAFIQGHYALRLLVPFRQQSRAANEQHRVDVRNGEAVLRVLKRRVGYTLQQGIQLMSFERLEELLPVDVERIHSGQPEVGVVGRQYLAGQLLLHQLRL